MPKILNNVVVKVIMFVIISTFVVMKIYINTYYTISQSKYIKSFNNSIEQRNLSITEFLSTFENAVEMLSKNEMIQSVSDNPEKYYDSTIEFLKNFQQSYSYTAFAYFAPDKKIFNAKKLVSWPDTSEELSAAQWEASKRPWYVNAVKSKGKIVWTEPYIDSTTQKYIITVSKSVTNKENKFKGVMAIDIYLDDISEKINYLRKFNEENIFIISRTDNENSFIIGDNENKELKNIFDESTINKIYSQKSGNLHLNDLKENYYISYTTNMVTGWKIVGVIGKQHLIKETNGMLNNIFIGVIIIVFISILSIIYVTKQMGSTIQILSGSIKSSEDKVNLQLNKVNNEKLENEEILFKKSTSNIDILFEIEGEKEKINQLISCKEELDLLKVKEIEKHIAILAVYKTRLNPSVKFYEAQKINLNTFLVETKNAIEDLSRSFSEIELKEKLNEISSLINTVINS